MLSLQLLILVLGLGLSLTCGSARPNRKGAMPSTFNPSSGERQQLVAASKRTRDKVKMRDTDTIIVSYPKSGTHWLATAVSAVQYPHWNNTMSSSMAVPEFSLLPPMYKFHNAPVIWLLPGTNASIPEIPDSVYDIVESIPRDVPRIFLSHMPRGLFEYAPTPKTKILFLLREPHSVWGSLMKWLSRSITVSETLGMTDALSDAGSDACVPETAFASQDLHEFTADFMYGNVPLPPRLVDHGPDFAWKDFVMKWWRYIDSASKSRSASPLVIDFSRAMLDQRTALTDILDLYNCDSNRNLDDVLETTSLENVRQFMGNTMADPSTRTSAVFQTLAHFGSASADEGGTMPKCVADDDYLASDGRTAWTGGYLDQFARLDQGMQRDFNRTHFAYRMIAQHTGDHPALLLV